MTLTTKEVAMLVSLQTILKPRALAGYQGKHPSTLLTAPVSALGFLDGTQVRSLRRHGVLEVKDLVALENQDRLWELGISRVSISALICFLFHPQHDPGPNCTWERLFQRAPLDYYIGYPGGLFHTRFGPVFYRGRLDGSARVLVVGQDPATDEIVAHRAFVGRAGQLAQNFLAKLGVTRSYLMFNAFLFGVQSGSLSPSMVTDATIMAYRNKLFDHAKATNPLTAILTFGNYARDSIANWPGKGSLPVVNLMHPTAQSGVAANWNQRLAQAHAAVSPDPDGQPDLTPYDVNAPIPSTDVPRRDLPFGVPAWHGTGGTTRSVRVSGSFETKITWTAP
jgi:uracil-DNA glycosylase